MHLKKEEEIKLTKEAQANTEILKTLPIEVGILTGKTTDQDMRTGKDIKTILVMSQKILIE